MIYWIPVIPIGYVTIGHLGTDNRKDDDDENSRQHHCSNQSLKLLWIYTRYSCIYKTLCTYCKASKIIQSCSWSSPLFIVNR